MISAGSIIPSWNTGSGFRDTDILSITVVLSCRYVLTFKHGYVVLLISVIDIGLLYVIIHHGNVQAAGIGLFEQSNTSTHADPVCTRVISPREVNDVGVILLVMIFPCE